jgi:hypothetical protein
MRRMLFSLVAVAVVFALAYGAAASLTVDGGVVQSGSDIDLTCDTSQVGGKNVSVSYTVEWVSGSGHNRFEVTSVTVSDIDSACGGKTLAVQLTGVTDGTTGALGSVKTVQISSSGSSPPCTFDANSSKYTCTVNVDDQSAEDVTDVHVAIY